MAVGLSANGIGTRAAVSAGADSGEKNGLAAWLIELIDGVRHRSFRQPRLAMVERISLAPRQTLSLVEADGQRFLVATSPEGTPAFYPLGFPARHPNRNRSLKAIPRKEPA